VSVEFDGNEIMKTGRRSLGAYDEEAVKMRHSQMKLTRKGRKMLALRISLWSGESWLINIVLREQTLCPNKTTNIQFF